MLNLERSASSISRRTLRAVWKKSFDTPLPNVLAFTFPDKEFYLVLEILQKNKGIIDTKVKEYGFDFGNEFVEACTFEFDGRLIIFVKASAVLDETLEHELRHVKDWKFQNKS